MSHQVSWRYVLQSKLIRSGISRGYFILNRMISLNTDIRSSFIVQHSVEESLRKPCSFMSKFRKSFKVESVYIQHDNQNEFSLKQIEGEHLK